MAFDKPAASLSASLLARKGQARPAMRPGLMLSEPTRVIEPTHQPDRLLVAEDLEPQPPTRAPQRPALAAPPVLVPAADPPAGPKLMALPALDEAETVGEAAITESVAASAPRVRAQPGQAARAAFTLRLDPDRHLRLRLLCAHRHKSAQQMLIEALDAWLVANPIALAKSACPCRETSK